MARDQAVVVGPIYAVRPGDDLDHLALRYGPPHPPASDFTSSDFTMFPSPQPYLAPPPRPLLARAPPARDTLSAETSGVDSSDLLLWNPDLADDRAAARAYELADAQELCVVPQARLPPLWMLRPLFPIGAPFWFLYDTGSRFSRERRDAAPPPAAARARG